jgi:hypothetical protein
VLGIIAFIILILAEFLHFKSQEGVQGFWKKSFTIRKFKK